MPLTCQVCDANEVLREQTASHDCIASLKSQLRECRTQLAEQQGLTKKYKDQSTHIAQELITYKQKYFEQVQKSELEQSVNQVPNKPAAQPSLFCKEKHPMYFTSARIKRSLFRNGQQITCANCGHTSQCEDGFWHCE